MKRSVKAVTLISILSLGCVVGCSAKLSTHEHKYDNMVVVKPTCSEQGYTKHSCECGESYMDSFTDVIDHSGSFVCQYCQKTFVSMWKNMCEQKGENNMIPVTGSDFYAMLTTNSDFEILITFGQEILTSMSSMTVAYSEIDNKWLYVYFLGDYSIGGKFDTVPSYASSLPYDYCQFKDVSTARGAAFEAFTNLVNLTNRQLESFDMRFNLRNLGILLK